jgi:hypothetical protein
LGSSLDQRALVEIEKSKVRVFAKIFGTTPVSVINRFASFTSELHSALSRRSVGANTELKDYPPPTTSPSHPPSKRISGCPHFLPP